MRKQAASTTPGKDPKMVLDGNEEKNQFLDETLLETKMKRLDLL